MLLNIAPGTSYQPVSTYDEFEFFVNSHTENKY